jgi:RimJ/RimL family protein N-acetyltransferase
MASLADLYQPLSDGDLTLEKIGAQHGDGLQAACAADEEIWILYPFSFGGKHFDGSFALLQEAPTLMAYVICLDGAIVGMTAWHDFSAPKASTHIGSSYIVPRLRGTGFNARVKRLMIDHAVACGFRRIAFTVDSRNVRSQRAVEKIGGVREGVLRAERITWTGHVRDTVVFSILANEWTARST